MLKKPESKNSLKTLKFRNRRLVLSFMRNNGAVSVNEISRATGLSKMTVHKIIDHYLEADMISHAGKGESTEEGGKRPNLFSFNAESRYIYMVRLGNDFLATSIVNLKGEQIVGRQVALLGEASFDAVVGMIADAFRTQVASAGLPDDKCLTVVVACNGIVDTERGLCLTAYQFPHWGRDLAIRDALRSRLPETVPVHVDAWWRHLAYGETHFVGKEERSRFFLIGNSGDYISGGLVVDGAVCQGAAGFAGELGHIIVAPENGNACVCGGSGCLEAMAAPGVVLKRAVARRADYPNSTVFASDLTGGLADVGKAADAGDELGRLCMDEMARHFAIAVNNIIHICDPGQIIFAGDLALCGEYFFEALRRRTTELCHRGIDKRTRIEPSPLTEAHGVVGAATHMTDTLFAGGR